MTSDSLDEPGIGPRRPSRFVDPTVGYLKDSAARFRPLRTRWHPTRMRSGTQALGLLM